MKGEITDTLEKRKNADKKVLLIFKIFILMVFTYLLFNLVISGSVDILTLLNVLTNGLTVSFFFIGTISWYYYRKNHILGYKKVLGYLLIIFAVISVVFIMALFIHYRGLDIEIFEIKIALRIWTFIIGFFTSMLGLFLGYFFFLVMGFGVVGVLSAFLRSHNPSLFDHIKNLNENTSQEMKNQDIFKYIFSKAVSWIFDIPLYLETTTLKVKKPEDEIEFPKNKFKTALIWEMFFCIILAINISLNPILLEHFSLNQLFGIASSIAIFSPMIVLPWFIYLKLEVEIEGPRKNFSLYEGLKSRVLGLLVALGTIITFVRLSFETIDLQVFLISFVGYLVGILILTVLFTFVYFNHYWRELIKDIYYEYERKF